MPSTKDRALLPCHILIVLYPMSPAQILLYFDLSALDTSVFSESVWGMIPLSAVIERRGSVGTFVSFRSHVTSPSLTFFHSSVNSGKRSVRSKRWRRSAAFCASRSFIMAFCTSIRSSIRLSKPAIFRCSAREGRRRGIFFTISADRFPWPPCIYFLTISSFRYSHIKNRKSRSISDDGLIHKIA